MTRQWMEAMQAVYALEAKAHGILNKAVLDETLDQLMRFRDSQMEPSWLVRNARSNARKKVLRVYSRTLALDRADFPAPPSAELEEMEWTDAIAQAGLTQRQRLILLRCGQGYSVKEIAWECGLTDKAVYRSRQRARDVLGESLGTEPYGKAG